MKLRLFLLTISYLLFAGNVLAQDPKPKAKVKSSSTKSSKSGSKKGKKGGGKDDLYKSNKNRDKKQDTQSMLISKGGQAKAKEAYISRPLYYGGRTYTGSIENIPGYRVCVYTGNNRQEAMKVKAAFNAQFRTIKSYMSYNLPNYKIKVGNYEDKKVALKALKEIQNKFPAAFVSPDKIIVVRRSLYVKPQPLSAEEAAKLAAQSTDTKPKPKKKKKVPKPNIIPKAEASN
jgi:hypothetical protein